jgi:hypothetical protein
MNNLFLKTTAQTKIACTLVLRKIEHHEITEILLKVELNSIILSKTVAFNN